jgi:hypothetical protein
VNDMPVRAPGQAVVRQHVPAVDERTPARVRDRLRAYAWSPGTFAGASFADLEALRVQAEEKAVRHG